MKKIEIYEALKAYTKNFQYAGSGLLYPNLTRSGRQELRDLYKEVFKKEMPTNIACNKCLVPYIVELSKWFDRQKFDEKDKEEVE